MSDHIEAKTASSEPVEKVEKIKTPFALIIVDGPIEKPYYSIMWWDTTDQEYNIGYSSYILAFVFDWLKAYFEVDHNAKHPHERTLDDLRPKGRWEPVDARYSRCTNCKRERNIRTQIGWGYCPNCGADMRGGGEDG